MINIHFVCKQISDRSHVGCARFAEIFKKFIHWQILWSLSSVDFFISKSNSQFQLYLNLHLLLFWTHYHDSGVGIFFEKYISKI